MPKQSPIQAPPPGSLASLATLATQGAVSHVLDVHGLPTRVLQWRPSQEKTSAGDAGAQPNFVLLHGYMDAAGTWDLVAARLAEAGCVSWAPDLRGYGRGLRVSRPGYYHFPDYVLDIAALFDALSDRFTGPVTLVGHSMGGVVATLFAGTFPKLMHRFVNVEGVGPPSHEPGTAPDRMRAFVEGTRKVWSEDRNAKWFSEEEAVRRLGLMHPHVDPNILKSRVPHLAEIEGAGDERRFRWIYDPLHRTRSPTPYSSDLFREFAAAVECPVLFVDGGPQGYHPPDETARLDAFRTLSKVHMEGAGHMVHWTQPENLAKTLVAFATR